MKIEIEIPLDENEWEVVSIEALPHYAVTDEISTYKNYVTIKKKQNWKDKIVFPSVYREGCWAAQCNTYWFYGIKIFINKPTFVNTEWLGAGGAMNLRADMNDLSFLPPEFWDCKPEDSLVQVTHEVKE